MTTGQTGNLYRSLNQRPAGGASSRDCQVVSFAQNVGRTFATNGQVFWLPDQSTTCAFPRIIRSGDAGFVPGYSGGTATDSHRLPYSPRGHTPPGTQVVRHRTPPAKVCKGAIFQRGESSQGHAPRARTDCNPHAAGGVATHFACSCWMWKIGYFFGPPSVLASAVP